MPPSDSEGILALKSICVNRVSQKKYGVANYQYFVNGAIYQYNILRQGKYNFYLGVCKVSIQYVKGK